MEPTIAQLSQRRTARSSTSQSD